MPGASNVNLSVFIGAQLRGISGAIAAFVGLTALPVAIVFGLGALYLHRAGLPGGGACQRDPLRHGRGGDRPEPRHRHPAGTAHLRRIIPAAVAIVIALAIGVLGFPLLHVLLVMLPVSLALAWLDPRA